MNTRRQIWIDRNLGLPLGIAMNGIVRVLGKFLRINHDLDRKFERIAIVKYKGLGSIVQTTPMLRVLKMNYPESKITFVTSIQNRDMINDICDIDKGLYFDDRSMIRSLLNLPAFVFGMWKSRFQILFDLELYSNISSVLSTFSCATNRFGFYLSAGQFRMGLYTHMMFFNNRIPLSETYLQMVRSLGVDVQDIGLVPFQTEGREELLKGFKIRKPYFAINVNASDLRIERRWSGESFALFTEKLIEKYPGHTLIFLGNGSEKKYVDRVIEKIRMDKHSIIATTGSTSLKDLICLIDNAELLITCDTGTAHIAYAQKVRTVVLFGPVSPSQFRIPENVGVIYKNIYCSPCVHEFDIPPCKGDNQCMKMIGVEEVLSMVEKVLQPDFRRNDDPNEVVYSGLENKTLGKVSR